MRKLTGIFILFALSLSACGPGHPDLRTLQLNREGNQALVGQTFPSAMDKYLQALSYDPFVGSLHLNLGLTFEGLQQAEQAMKSYKEAENLALKEEDGYLVFMARFNQAQLLGKAKQVDAAIAMYQKALDINPTSLEAKTNIELLTQSQQGSGGDQNKDQKDQQGDQKQDQSGGGQGKDQKDQKDKGDDQKDSDKDQDGKDKEKKEEPKKAQSSPKYKPRPFNGKELGESDVKKILGELKQQEEKIRAEYNRKDTKEQPRDKDW